MRKIITFLLLLLVGLHSTAALCLCPPEEAEVSTHHCHEEQTEATHSDTQSHEQDSHSSAHHHEEGQSCSCMQEASDLPTKLELSSFHTQIKNLIWIISSFIPFLNSNLNVQSSFNTIHNLGPPLVVPLYLQKTSFLI